MENNNRNIDKMFNQFQNEILYARVQKYKEENDLLKEKNTELRAIIIKFASRIAELERSQKYL